MLKWKPKPRKPVTLQPKLGQFNVIEEYTIDEQSTLSKKTAIVRPTSVETTSQHSSTSTIGVTQNSPDPVKPNTKICEAFVETSNLQPSTLKPPDITAVTNSVSCDTPKIVYSEDNSDFYVESSTTVPKNLPSVISPPEDYPWKKQLKVSIRCLSDFEISYWSEGHSLEDLTPSVKVETSTSDTVASAKLEPEDQSASDMVVLKTEPKVSDDAVHPGCKRSHQEISDASSSDSPPGESTEKLLAHAKSLINKVSAALSTTDRQKTGGNTALTNTKTSHQVAGHKHHPTPKPMQVETQELPSQRAVNCRMCKYTCASIAELTSHHQNNHGIVNCSTCGKGFSSKASLNKHMYTHTNSENFVCEECGKGFPFKSRLLQHQVIHDEGRFLCKQVNCNKSFKNKGDLTRHEGTHSDKWYSCNHCSYKNKDKRNLESHSRTHEAKGQGLERYFCNRCGKYMRFNTQWHRHLETGCKTKLLHV